MTLHQRKEHDHGALGVVVPPETSQTSHLPRVTVLMAVRDGIRFLPEQIDSIAAQYGIDLRLIVSDDGSNDGSYEFLVALAKIWPEGRLTVLQGPRRGYAANFVSLVKCAPPNAGYVAFSDQDDVWVGHRLRSAVEALRGVGDCPGLHLSARWIADEDLNIRKVAQLQLGRLSFSNSLVESVVPGNASVMNPQAFAILQEGIMRQSDVSSHDWSMYQLLSGAEAVIVQSEEPLVVYRQHQKNVKGAGGSMRWRISRLLRFASGSYGRSLYSSWNFLGANMDQLSHHNQIILERAYDLTATSITTRLAALRAGGFFRLRRVDCLALWVAVLLGTLGRAIKEKLPSDS